MKEMQVPTYFLAALIAAFIMLAVLSVMAIHDGNKADAQNTELKEALNITRQGWAASDNHIVSAMLICENNVTRECVGRNYMTNMTQREFYVIECSQQCLDDTVYPQLINGTQCVCGEFS